MTDKHNHPYTQGYKEAEMTDIENRDQHKQASIANISTDTSQKIQQDWAANLSKIQIQLPPIVFTPEMRRNLTSTTSILSTTVLSHIQQTSLSISNNSELITSLTQTMSKLHLLNEDLNKRLAKSIAAIDFSPILKEYNATIKTSDTFTAPLGLDLEKLINTQTLPIDATAGPEAYAVISKDAPELAASIDVAADKAGTGLLSKKIVRYSLAYSVLLIIAMAILVGNNNIKILPPEWASLLRSITQIGLEGSTFALMIGKGKSE